MAKRANAGELRTKIMVFDLPRDEHGEVELGPDGYPASKPVNVFGEGKTRYCKWVNAWGTEVYTARQAGDRAGHPHPAVYPVNHHHLHHLPGDRSQALRGDLRQRRGEPPRLAGGQSAAEGGGEMTLNQRIIQVLSPLGLPVVPDVDTLHRPRCLVFNYDLLPAQPADNRPTWYKALIQVHLYLPLGNDGRELRRQVMEALVDAGMTWPEIIDATDDETQHKVFECETLVGKDDL